MSHSSSVNAMIYAKIVLIKHQSDLGVGGERPDPPNCSLTRLTFALHESVRACAVRPRRFIDVDRVTSRGLCAFNYNTLLPNKSNPRPAPRRPLWRIAFNSGDPDIFYDQIMHYSLLPFLSLSPSAADRAVPKPHCFIPLLGILARCVSGINGPTPYRWR